MTKLPARAWRALTLAGCLLIGNVFADVADSGANLSASYYDNTPPGPALSLDALDAILDDLNANQASALSMWDQLWVWIRDFMRSRDQGTLPDWLNDFRISAEAAAWVFYATCVLIVLLAAGIIINELRHGRGRRRVAGSPVATPMDFRAPDSPTAAQLAALPLHEQPALLLNLMLAHLKLERSGRPACLTHREIVAATVNLAPPRRQPVHRIAAIAERIRYSERLPADAEVTPIVEQARALLSELSESGQNR